MRKMNREINRIARMRRDRWVPFGVVRDAGMLFFDLLAVHKGQPTVLWEDPAQKRTELGLADAFFGTLQS